jgi:DNA-binding response OmpR family regulator
MSNEGTRPLVLLVEDNDFVRQLWAEELEDAHYGVTAVSRPHAALAALASGKCQAAIVDIGLPEMSGAVLVALVRAINPLLPILVVTGFDAHDYIHLEDRDTQVLQKPVKTSSLLQRLEALLAG